MLALRIDLLTGRYVATAYNDRYEGEWPIHPARVFSALVAALHDADSPDPLEREALLWLERLPAPDIAASNCGMRTAARVFVPVNDVGSMPDFSDDARACEEAKAELAAAKSGAADGRAIRSLQATAKKLEDRLLEDYRAARTFNAGEKIDVARALAVLPERRGRQPRTFPCVVPDDPVCHFVWRDAAPPAAVRGGLERLARRVTRIGHSSSLVALRWVNDPPRPTWTPSDNTRGARVLRVVSEGQLERLEEEFGRHRETSPRTLPCGLVPYRSASNAGREAACGNLGEDWLVFGRIQGPAFPSHRGPELAKTLRDALMSAAADPIKVVLSGHEPSGRRTDRPHVACVPLPFVGHRYADGSILGIAVVLPRETSEDDRQYIEDAVVKLEDRAGAARGSQPPPVRLVMGAAGELTLQRVVGLPGLRTLDPDAWCRASRTWATATPIALDRHPGDLRSRSAAKAAEALRRAVESVESACTHIGLPAPTEVRIDGSSAVGGAEHAAKYGPYPARAGRFRRELVHAVIRFERPVAGPVVLGAGRFQGLGLCRPL